MFHRREKLAEPNCPPDWLNGAWRSWEGPRGVVRGESYRQEALIGLTGPPRPQGYLVPIAVTLRRDPKNPYDRNAFRAEIQGQLVGYLAKELAAVVAPGVDRLRCREFTVAGIIRGGVSGDRPYLGVHLWLDRRLSPGPHIEIADDSFAVPWPPTDGEGQEGMDFSRPSSVRTGASARRRSWRDLNPSNPISVIKECRVLLESETRPLDRHFTFMMLEQALYKCRDVFPSALEEFEEACEQHHAEMEAIRAAFMAEHGGIPHLPTYRQMAIMKSKAGDYAAALEWCQRGLAVYGRDGVRDDLGADDLRRRIEKLRARLT